MALLRMEGSFRQFRGRRPHGRIPSRWREAETTIGSQDLALRPPHPEPPEAVLLSNPTCLQEVLDASSYHGAVHLSLLLLFTHTYSLVCV